MSKPVKTKPIDVSLTINPSLNIAFVNPAQIAEYEAQGFSILMSRKPNISALLSLTEQEIAITKLLLLGNTPQQIAGLLSSNEANIRKAIRNIRAKLGCKNTIELIIKIKDDGLDSYLLQNE